RVELLLPEEGDEVVLIVRPEPPGPGDDVEEPVDLLLEPRPEDQVPDPVAVEPERQGILLVASADGPPLPDEPRLLDREPERGVPRPDLLERRAEFVQEPMVDGAAPLVHLVRAERLDEDPDHLDDRGRGPGRALVGGRRGSFAHRVDRGGAHGTQVVSAIRGPCPNGSSARRPGRRPCRPGRSARSRPGRRPPSGAPPEGGTRPRARSRARGRSPRAARARRTRRAPPHPSRSCRGPGPSPSGTNARGRRPDSRARPRRSARVRPARTRPGADS